MANYTLLTADFGRKEERNVGNSHSKTPGCHCKSDRWEDVKLCMQTLLWQFPSTCCNSHTHTRTHSALFSLLLSSPCNHSLESFNHSLQRVYFSQKEVRRKATSVFEEKEVFCLLPYPKLVPLVRLETPVVGAWDWWLKRKGAQWCKPFPKIFRLKS